MSRQSNRYGLARQIPVTVKREVRRACGFGCVVCGNTFIQYHHAGIEYANATTHDPAKITLLCGGCHDRVSRGTYSNEKIDEHIQRPYCLTNGPAHTELDYGTIAPHVSFAGSVFENCTFPIRVHDYGVVRLDRPVEAGAPVLLSALFTNSRGEINLAISANEVMLMPDNWDATAEGTRLRLWDDRGQPSLTLNVRPRQALEIERIESLMLGWRFSGNTTALDVTMPGSRRPNRFVGSRISGGNVGFQFGRPTLR